MNYEFYLAINPGSYEEEVVIKVDMDVKIVSKDGQTVVGGVVGINHNCIEIDSTLDNITIDVDHIQSIRVIESEGE